MPGADRPVHDSPPIPDSSPAAFLESWRGFCPTLFMLAFLFWENHMRDVSELRLLCCAFCKPYQSEAKFYVEETSPSGWRQLVVIYEKGGYGGGKEFAAGIPKAWTDQDVENLIFWPMKDPRAPYPAWEVPTRVHGKPVLFEFWKDEKSDL